MKTQKVVNPNHVVGIDLLRFIAAVIVLGFHYGVAARANEGARGLADIRDWTHFGWVGVEIFFVISGFVIAFSGEKASPFDFLVSRIVRLGPGVWICASITFLVAIAMAPAGSHGPLRGYAHSILFIPMSPYVDASYWTLAIEISFYAMVFLLIKINRFDLIRSLAIGIGTISGLFWIAAVWIALDPGNPAQKVMLQLQGSRVLNLLLVHHGMFFALGVFLWLGFKKAPDKRNIGWCVFFCFTGCLQIVMEAEATTLRTGAAYTPYAACLIWLLSVALIVVLIKMNAIIHAITKQWILRAARTAGLITFPLYLLHQVIGIEVMIWAVRVGVDPWVALISAIILIFMLALAVAKIFEPMLQRITRSILIWLRVQRNLRRARGQIIG
jgi:peptidoglycan/LPS O-acetylase OafA/YrhL